MSKRTLDQQIADLEARKQRDRLRVHLRHKIASLKTAAGQRDYRSVLDSAAEVTGLSRTLLEMEAGSDAPTNDASDDLPGGFDESNTHVAGARS